MCFIIFYVKTRIPHTFLKNKNNVLIPVDCSFINKRDLEMNDSSWLSVQENETILLSSVFYFIKLLSIDEIKNLLQQAFAVSFYKHWSRQHWLALKNIRNIIDIYRSGCSFCIICSLLQWCCHHIGSPLLVQRRRA